MRKDENPSKQNDILVAVKVTLIYFTFWLVGQFTLAIWCEVPHCFEDRNATSRCIVLDLLAMEMGCCLLDIYPYPFFFILNYLLCHKWRKAPNFSHYCVWQKPSSKWHTVFVFCFLFFVFCFCFVLFVFFSILANLYINFKTGKLPAHERNNFIFHVSLHFCNTVLFH
jgi:hypothetical protein